MSNQTPRRRLLIVIVSLLALTLALPVAAQDDADALQAACEDLWGTWNAETQKCENNITYSVSIEYPVEYAQYDVVTAPVNALINQQRDELLGARPYVDSPLDPSPGYELDLSYDAYAHSDTVVSLLYTVFAYMGGAHPNTTYETFTFDLDAGEQLSLYDIFPEANNPLDVIAPIAEAAQIEQQGDYADENWIAQGTAPTLDNYRDFVLTENSIIFFFEPYQVAAYAYGPSQVEIPLADLTSIMAGGALSDA